jgi:hypothetical protein
MPRDGTGQYNLPNPAVVTGTAISSTDENATRSDMATALTASIARDGQTVPLANLPMGGFKHTGVANGAAATDYATFGQLTTTNTNVTNLAATVTAIQERGPFLTNGRFDAWQASTSLAIPASTTATASIYAADQWCMETSANQASVVSQQAGTGTARFRVRVQRNAGQTGTTVLRFQQPLELSDVVNLRGQIVTVSCTAKAGANFSGALRLKLLTGTGTESRRTNAASFTSEATPLDAAMAIATTDAAYTGTSTAVSASATQAALVFEWTPSGTAGAADWFEVQDVWLDFGAVANAMPYEPVQQVLARAQRFFEVCRAHAFGRNELAAPTTQTNGLYFKVTKRAVPIATFAASISTSGVTARASANVTTGSTGIQLTTSAGPINYDDTADWAVDARL